MLSRRYLIDIDHDGKERIIPLKMTDSVLSWSDMPNIIRDPTSWLTQSEISEIARACIDRIVVKSKELIEHNTSLARKLAECRLRT